MAEKLPIAFLAGLLSVVTPCVLPLVPGYLAALSSIEVDALGKPGSARRVVLGSVPFILGFTAVFVVLGAGAAAIASVVPKTTQTEIAGFVLIVIGLAFAGLLPFPTRTVAPGLLQGARRTGSGALLGGAFAVCAAPCIGTVLASVLVLASSTGTIARAIVLLATYSLGLGAAFVLAGIAFAHADARVSLGARPLRRRSVRLRRDARRARAAALLPPRRLAARRSEPGALAGRARNALTPRAAIRRRGRGDAARTVRADAVPLTRWLSAATGFSRPRW